MNTKGKIVYFSLIQFNIYCLKKLSFTFNCESKLRINGGQFQTTGSIAVSCVRYQKVTGQIAVLYSPVFFFSVCKKHTVHLWWKQAIQAHLCYYFTNLECLQHCVRDSIIHPKGLCFYGMALQFPCISNLLCEKNTLWHVPFIHLHGADPSAHVQNWMWQPVNQ